jgi:predicted O-methyltransferase YrrM
VILSRYTSNHTVNFLKFMAGLRKAATSVSEPERTLLADLARGRQCIVEVGVFEGATSQIFCKEMSPSGRLYLVDPYFPEVRLERLLNRSFNLWIATKTVDAWRQQVQFVRETSEAAASKLPLKGSADMIFIDARHDYESVLQDFRCWTPILAPHAPMAFHDSNPCPERPDLGENDGPVRLMREIRRGEHGHWEIVTQADTVTVIRQ